MGDRIWVGARVRVVASLGRPYMVGRLGRVSVIHAREVEVDFDVKEVGPPTRWHDGQLEVIDELRWRVGRKLGLTIYRDDKYVASAKSPEDAAEIVAAANRGEPAPTDD